MKVSIIDYGAGNISSIQNALNFLGIKSEVCQTPNKIEAADAIIVPGVGAFAEGMNNLHHLNLVDALKDAVLKKETPYLGICLGMQYLADYSLEDGRTDGLGFIGGSIEKIETSQLSVPNVGWRSLNILHDESLFCKNANERFFYFDHSYHFQLKDKKHLVASIDYEQEIIAAVNLKNIFGVQFHPEKSQYAGLKFLKNYYKMLGLRDGK